MEEKQKQFSLGNIKWKVLEELRTDVDGLTEPELLRIIISSKIEDGNKKDLTFFHELTHAVLYMMGSELYDNEEFVNTFSTLFNQGLRTYENK